MTHKPPLFALVPVPYEALVDAGIEIGEPLQFAAEKKRITMECISFGRFGTLKLQQRTATIMQNTSLGKSISMEKKLKEITKRPSLTYLLPQSMEISMLNSYCVRFV